MSDYKGPERRNPKLPSRRKGAQIERIRNTFQLSKSQFLAVERRRTDRNAGRLLQTGDPPTNLELTRPNHETGTAFADPIRDRRHRDVPHFERRKTNRRSSIERRQGPGRRADDLARALAKGEPVVFDMSKAKGSKSFLKKAAKKGGALGLAISIGNLARELKAN